MKLVTLLIYFLLLPLAMELLVRLYWIEPPATTLVGGNHPKYHHWPSYMSDDLVGQMDMRRKMHPIKKAPGVTRIVFLGDSYTFGLGVPANQTIASFLQERLDREHGRGKFEVLNYGMISYSPIIEELIYRDIISRLYPDLVIMQMDAFDPQEDHLYSEMAEFDSTGATEAINGIPPEHRGLEKLAMVRFFKSAINIIRYGGSPLRPDLRMDLRSDFFYNPARHKDWLDFSFSIIARLNARIKSDGAKLLLVTYPNPLYLKNKDGYENAIRFISNDFIPDEHETKLPDIIMQHCRSNGIECLDLWPDFRRQEEQPSPDRGRDEIFNRVDGHYTAWANKWVSALIHDALQYKKKDSAAIEKDNSPKQ